MAVLHWPVRESRGSAGCEPGYSLPQGQLGLLMWWSHSSERTREGYKLPWAFLSSRKSTAVFLKHSASSKARPDKIQGGAGEGYFKGRFCKECVSFSSNSQLDWNVESPTFKTLVCRKSPRARAPPLASMECCAAVWGLGVSTAAACVSVMDRGCCWCWGESCWLVCVSPLCLCFDRSG